MTKKITKKQKTYKALIVEDEEPLAYAVKSKMEKWGISAVTARTADQVINYLKEVGEIDFIWLDHYLLGEENGLDIMVRLKSEESPWKNIPVFVVSNTVGQDKICEYIEFGAQKYYVKAEVKLDDVVGEIKNFLSKKEK